MRLPRLACLVTIAALVTLAACSSSGHSSRPSRASTSTSKARSTTSTTKVRAATSAPTTVKPTAVPGTTSTVSALGGPHIIRLSGPALPVQCNAPTSVELHWETRDADSVTLRIDAEPIFATYGGGSNDKLVPLACDGNAHRYTLTARAADGRTATRSLTLTERVLATS